MVNSPACIVTCSFGVGNCHVKRSNIALLLLVIFARCINATSEFAQIRLRSWTFINITHWNFKTNYLIMENYKSLYWDCRSKFIIWAIGQPWPTMLKTQPSYPLLSVKNWESREGKYQPRWARPYKLSLWAINSTDWFVSWAELISSFHH